MDQNLVGQTLIAVLLIRIAFAASVSSLLVRADAFKRLLLSEERTFFQRLMLAFLLSGVFGGGAAIRAWNSNYAAVDMGMEASLIAGVVGGYVPGLIAGVLISTPAFWVKSELLSLPLYAAVGVLGGLVRDIAPERAEIWKITAFPDLSLYRVLRQWSDPQRLFHVFFLAIVLAVESLRFLASREIFGGMIFATYPEPGAHFAQYVAVWAATLFTVIVPLKIWSNARTEQMLEMQQRLLQESRLRALTSQINPHFLFNTLNSIASLVRTNPETARVVIQKLSNILRRLLRKHENLASLREEISFIDDYLSIELVRFGDKLRFVKDVTEDSLNVQVPSMMLQPIIENCIKHGLASKVEGGFIRLKAWQAEGRLHLLIEDDGVGIPDAELANIFTKGIGVSNVNERLKVLYDGDYKMWIDSKLGEGTRTGIEIPAAYPTR